MPTALYDDFTNSLGEFSSYDTYDSGQRTQLARQKHVDIRSFEQDAITYPYTMFALDHLALIAIEGLTMSQLETGNILYPGENWTSGTVGQQSDRAHFNGISLSCSAGTTSTTSVAGSLDLSGFSPTDYISLALPAYPLANLTASACFLDLTSEPTGNFGTGPTDSIPFSSSTTTLVSGDCEARLPLALLSTVNKAAITGVRLRIAATATCTFRCLGIRCIATTWEYGAIDINTLYERLGATIPPSGAPGQPYAFPAPAPYEGGRELPPWPILLRSDGESGPAMVDLEVGTIIETGSNTEENLFSLYFRELPMEVQAMAALDALTMTDLELLNQQPDYFIGQVDDYQTTRYLTVTLRWGSGNAVEFFDETGNGYSLISTALNPLTHYYFLVTLRGDSLRAQIYPLSSNGVPDLTTVVYDSTAIVDPTFVQRRRGRFGWAAQLGEGNTYIRSIRPRRAVYSEYRSAPLRSATPVEGARLYPSATPDVELLGGVTATPGATVNLDATKSRSGKCLKVQCSGNIPLEGLISSTMRFENLYDTEVEFDVLAPYSAQLTALLSGEGRLVALYIPVFPTNRWTHISIPLAQFGANTLPGPYSLYLIQIETGQNTWYIDNLSIHTRAVSWEGRGEAGDPWRMNNPAWINFGDTINSPTNGALLGRGHALQVRGQTLTETAAISGVKILPQYSTLGRFVWTDQEPVYEALPVPAFTTGSAPPLHAISFDASTSTAQAGIAGYYWSFGDGVSGYGRTITHQYETAGTYTTTLVVVDTQNQKAALSQLVVVS